MHVEYHKWYSPNMGQDMELKTYGHAGKPMVVFPCQDARYHDYEDRGMLHAMAPWIDSGRLQVISVDGRDWESWTNKSVHPALRAARHNDYDRYIMQEVVPFVRQKSGHQKAIANGASMGGFHSANFFFKHPDAFDGLIAMSGLYRPTEFIGDHMCENTYYNSPLDYLPNLNDPWYLEQYRNSHIIFSVGQGRWEDQMRIDTDQMRSILAAKGIPAWIDFWGHDVDHDWPAWLVQLPYFLSKLPL